MYQRQVQIFKTKNSVCNDDKFTDSNHFSSGYEYDYIFYLIFFPVLLHAVTKHHPKY